MKNEKAFYTMLPRPQVIKRVNTGIQHPLTGESLVAKKRALKALAQHKYSTN